MARKKKKEKLNIFYRSTGFEETGLGQYIQGEPELRIKKRKTVI